MTSTENLLRKRSATSRDQDASFRLLATVALFALTGSLVSIGILMAVLVQAMPTIGFVMQDRP